MLVSRGWKRGHVATAGVLGLGQAAGDVVTSRSVLVKGCSCFSEVANLAYMRLWRHAGMCSWPAVIRMLLEEIFEQEYFDFLNLVQPAIVGHKERSS